MVFKSNYDPEETNAQKIVKRGHPHVNKLLFHGLFNGSSLYSLAFHVDRHGFAVSLNVTHSWPYFIASCEMLTQAQGCYSYGLHEFRNVNIWINSRLWSGCSRSPGEA